jgi:non-specific serine/threonine protein kinase
MLEAGPAVTILATSRERLGIAAEQTYPLAAFAVPPRDTVAPDDLAAFASVRFLSERATAAQPDFAITRDNAGAVAAICQQLDGIPLALELAAARLRSMPVSAIAERLGDRFRLLSGGDRTASPRQQTLRALIDWSYDLLSPEERSLFGRLSMFAGGFTLEAAEAVGIDEGRAPDLLSQLVDKSLVTFEPSRSRYGMLETVRRYARDKLAASGDDAAARAAYVAWHANWIEKAGPLLLGPEQGVWMQRIDVELDNLLSAHAACEELPDSAQAGLRLANSLKHYWLSRGLLDLGLRTTLAALDRWQHADVDRGRGLFNAGQFAIEMGRYVEAQAYLESCLTIARGMGQRVGAVLQPLGQAAMCRGDLTAANTYLNEALAIARGSGETRSIAAALNGLAHLHRLEGDFGSAAIVCRQAVALAREVGDPESIAKSLLDEAVVSIEGGEVEGATSMVRGAVEILREIGSRSTARSVLDVMTALAMKRGDRRAAARFHRAAEALLAHTQARRNPADDLFLRRYIDGVLTLEDRAGTTAPSPDTWEVVTEAADWLSSDDSLEGQKSL